MNGKVLWLVSFAVVSPTFAQTTVTHLVVPGACAMRDGDGATLGFAGAYVARNQLLIDSKHLVRGRGQEIRSLALRQDGSGRSAIAGRLWIEAWLSTSPKTSETASASFADNRGSDHVQVFAGYVSFPGGKPAVSPAPWLPSLGFVRPFAYRGGTLCLEVVTRLAQGNDPPQPPAWFALDADVRLPAGEIQRYGLGCLPAMVASAPPTRFVVGATGSFNLAGAARVGPGIALLLIGSQPAAWSLEPVAPGCTLLVEPQWLVPLAVAVLGEVAGTRFELPLPVQRSLQGATLYAQWALVDRAANRLGLAFTEGLRAKIGSPSHLGCAWLESPDLAATQARIDTDAIPVLRLEMVAK